MMRTWLGLAVVVCTVSVRSAAAQSPRPGVVSGTVRDSSGVAIAGADVTIPGTSARSETGDDGAFRFTIFPVDSLVIRVRRLGFRPSALTIRPATYNGDPLRIVLAPLAQSLQPVVVVGGHSAGPDRLQGFAERRREGGGGRFMTHDEIERQHVSRMSDLMRFIPGANVARSSYPPNAVRFRGQACAPLTWLDGFPLLAGEFDLDAIQPESIEAMEIYSGPATIPLRFRGPLASQQCGAIVIWSRSGRLRARDQGDRSVAAEIAQLVEEQKVFTADQVETPAQIASPLPMAPAYPDSLFSAHVSGTVLAEFVVDQKGEVSNEQITIVTSSHPLFSDAVRLALPHAKFVPAQRSGRSVKQVMQWSFRFDADSEKK